MRPHVVWFGEVPLQLDEIFADLDGCDLFVAIVAIGNVYPAAGFVRVDRAAGAHTVKINLAASEVNTDFAETRLGPASEQVSDWVAELPAD